MNLPANLWRSIVRYAGAHVRTEADDVFLASNCVVHLHSLESARKRITRPGKYRVRDLIDGTEYAKSADATKLDLEAPETRVFLLEEYRPVPGTWGHGPVWAESDRGRA